LAAYLRRKLRERGWEGAGNPAVEGLAERLAALGYIDDAVYALGKARALGQRGFGRRRVTMALRQAGVGEEDGRAAQEEVAGQTVGAALRFARRRRLGPFALERPDPKARDRALAAMLRAGHEFDLSRRIINLAPGSVGDFGEDFTKLLELS
ncbi:MAG: RecX family transcriptional regulator, partial [Pseudomonadota bacterium]|nr:RecX family transcriptional regulator [Pseudomonadota bacterium]